MFTDIVGYTSLSQADEEATLRLLEEHQKLLRPVFSRHGGREVKTMGDAFLVEFASSLDALRCALDIQGRIEERNAKGKPQRLRVRIGIHVGEVIGAGDDVYGDAVNIAARIEPLAEPGGICISKQVFDLVQGKVVAKLASMGSVELKNVRAPIEIYKVLPTKAGAGERLPASLKTRVAVLPFDNYSSNSGDDYFADGLTEELIGTLSKIHELSVISRTSVMQYKGKPKSISEIGRELNAGTILEGSVRKAGDRVRVSIQMVDATEDKHVWAESYDRDLEDIFSVQSDIAAKVAEALKLELLTAEKKAVREAPTKNAEANLLFLKGVYQGEKGSPSDIMKAIEYFELAVEQDPEFALAYASIAAYYVAAAGEAIPSETAFPKAKAALARAMAIDPDLAEAHNAKAWIAFQYDWDWKAAEASFKEAIALKPSLAFAHDWYGRMLAALGRFDEAIAETGRAYELDPASPWVTIRFAMVYWMAGRNKEAREMFSKVAREMFSKVARENPKFGRAHGGLAFVNATEGRKEDVMKEIDAAVALGDEAYFRTHQAVIYASVGSTQKARKILENLLAGKYKGFATPAWIAAIYYWLGDQDKGYEWMVKAYESRDPSIPWYNKWPILDVERRDPRFVQMLRKMKLP
jgi:adenylate cyclase